jgi:hypothetical protein
MMSTSFVSYRPARAVARVGRAGSSLAFAIKKASAIHCIEIAMGRSASQLEGQEGADGAAWRMMLDVVRTSSDPPTPRQEVSAEYIVRMLTSGKNAPVAYRVAQCFAEFFGLPAVLSVTGERIARVRVSGCSACERFAHRAAVSGVGAVNYWCPHVAGANVSGIFGADVTASGNELVAAMLDGLGQLQSDVASDACGDFYTAACKGMIPAVDALESKLGDMEASGTKLEAKNVLEAAGVDASDANVKAFGKCVLPKEDPTTHAVPRGTLAYCAIVVRDQTSGGAPLLPASHTTAGWRDRFEAWANSFRNFAQDYQQSSGSIFGDSPSDAQLSKHLGSYNLFRDEFVNGGGATTAPSIDEPWSLGTKLVVLGVVGLALYVAVEVLLRRLG